MIKEALQHLAEQAVLAAGPVVQQVDGHTYATDDLTRVDVLPHVKPMECLTLQAIIDYLKANKDALDLTKLTVHVCTAESVYVKGAVDRAVFGDGERDVFLWARPIASLTHRFASQMTPEDFVIYLQTHFANSGQRDDVMKLVGSITTGGINTFADDGVTQEVTVKTGAARLGSGVIKNPFMLAPFRSFPEIAPVMSPFILRASAQGDKLPSIALHECDGGAWKVTAINRVAEWLQKNLPAGPAVIA